MTNNSSQVRNVLPERLDRLSSRDPSGRTDRSDRTINIPETRVNGATVNGTAEQPHDNEDDEFTVPILPMGIAIICGVLNFILPGFGTILAGICAPCCAKSEIGIKDYSCLSSCVIIGVGILQLLLTACFLIGWVWSAIWGIALIGTASDFANYSSDPQSTYWRNRPLSNRSRRSVRPRSNFIYPMRAPSNIDYNSPPPPYQMFGSPPPRYSSRLSSERYLSAATTPATLESRRQNDRISSGRTMTTTQLIEEASEVMSWDCPQCNRVYEADTRQYTCRRCSREVCARCYRHNVRTRENDRVTVCDRCFMELSHDVG